VLNVTDRRNKTGDRDKALQCILKVMLSWNNVHIIDLYFI